MLEQILATIYQGRKIQLDPYVYMAPTFVFTGAGTQTNIISIQADSDFIILTTMYWVDVALAAETRSNQNLFNGTVLLTDSGSGRQLMNAPVPVDSMFGNGQFPFVWPQPKIFGSKSTIQVQATQLQTTTQNLYLAFSGVKVFTEG